MTRKILKEVGAICATIIIGLSIYGLWAFGLLVGLYCLWYANKYM